MVCNYFFTARAEQDFDETINYIIADLNNPTAAQTLGRKIFEVIDNICEFPLSGALVVNSGIADNTVRRLIIDNYLLYYKFVEPDKLYILRIVYGQRKQPDIS